MEAEVVRVGVGALRKVEASADTRSLAEALLTLDISEATFAMAVRLLGGRHRTRVWSPVEAGSGMGFWGNIENQEHVAKAVKRMAKMLGRLFGRVLGMRTGVGRDGDMDDAFKLLGLYETCAADLSPALALEAMMLVFKNVVEQARALRTERGAAMPCIWAARASVAEDVLADMRCAERVDEQVAARLAAFGHKAGGKAPLPTPGGAADAASSKISTGSNRIP